MPKQQEGKTSALGYAVVRFHCLQQVDLFPLPCHSHFQLNVPDVNKQPVLKASAIKYVMTFRTVLAKEVLVSSLPFICNFLKSNSVVVHSYAAHTLERVFTVPGEFYGSTVVQNSHESRRK